MANAWKKKDGLPPNRRERRQAQRNEKALERSSLSQPKKKKTNLSKLPVWTKMLIGAIVFTFCGGFNILEFISDQASHRDPSYLLSIVPIIILSLAIYGRWSWQVAGKTSSNGRETRRSRGASPLERVHGRWRLKQEGTEPVMPKRETAGQLRGRMPSKMYHGSVRQAAQVSPGELGQIALPRPSGVEQSQIVLPVTSLAF